jgi:hypothetical protein
MTTTITEYGVNDHVRAAVALPGVPVGTRGRIKLRDGFAWIRYWVLFDNGVDLGSIDGSQLRKTDRHGQPLDD